MPPIGLITDFGNEDYFVGAMKGAILNINPEAKIVDITHKIPKHNIKNASFILANAAEAFPRNSIFVTVIDPGVGTERRVIFLRTKNGFNFVGPDNGVFSLVVERWGIEQIREVSNQDLMRSDISTTFHGRDIMAPIGAHLSLGLEYSKVGSKIEDLKLLDITEPELKDGEICGEVVNVDDFGNIVTNIPEDLVKELGSPNTRFQIKINDSDFEVPFVKAFGEVPKGEMLCCIGSANTLEIAKNQESLAHEINAEKKDELNIKISKAD